MDHAKAHVGKLETQLKRWGATLDELMAKAEGAGAEAKADYRQRLVDAKDKYQTAHSKLAELRTAGGDNWETLKAGLDKSWHELEVAFSKLKN